MSAGKRRVFSREFKLSAVKRMMAGERGQADADAGGWPNLVASHRSAAPEKQSEAEAFCPVAESMLRERNNCRK
jgi:hypothetical protein